MTECSRASDWGTRFQWRGPPRSGWFPSILGLHELKLGLICHNKLPWCLSWQQHGCKIAAVADELIPAALQPLVQRERVCHGLHGDQTPSAPAWQIKNAFSSPASQPAALPGAQRQSLLPFSSSFLPPGRRRYCIHSSRGEAELTA